MNDQDFAIAPGARYVPPLLVVVSGPSGVGKDVVLARMKERQLPFHYAVTATTRPRRDYEIEGVHYYFRTVEEFQVLIDQGELLENATVYGNYYGPPKAGVREHLAQGEDVILKIDVQGAAHVKMRVSNAVFIFIAPGTREELISRLRNRGTEDAESLALRIATYEREMQAAASFDYVVINRDGELDATVDNIAAILKAEKSRVNPRLVQL